MWAGENHNKTIDYDAVNWSASQRQIMKNCSAWADSHFPATSNSGIPALHGAGNYVGNLEYLWYFAIFLGRQNTTTDKAIQNAKNSAVNKIKNTTVYKNKDKNHLGNLINNSNKLVTFNGKTYDTNLTASVMKTRIKGYAAHLVGDVFAHRVMIPNTSGFTLSDFDSDFPGDVKAGIVAFRDITLYIKDGIKYNEKYIDNPSFRPNRYSDASSNISDMLTRSTATYDWYGFLCPMSSDVKLQDFKKFVTQAGLDTSILTSSEWSKYST